ncbi:hypothetical protein L0244_04430 [bacterium]|nr:hypothetical protein [bacterium]
MKRKFFARPTTITKSRSRLFKDFATVCNGELRIKRPVKLICFQPGTKRSSSTLSISSRTLGVTNSDGTVWVRADLPLEEALCIIAHELAHIRQLERIFNETGSKKTTKCQDRKMEKAAMDYELSWRLAFSDGVALISLPTRIVYKRRVRDRS